MAPLSVIQSDGTLNFAEIGPYKHWIADSLKKRPAMFEIRGHVYHLGDVISYLCYDDEVDTSPPYDKTIGVITDYIYYGEDYDIKQEKLDYIVRKELEEDGAASGTRSRKRERLMVQEGPLKKFRPSPSQTGPVIKEESVAPITEAKPVQGKRVKFICLANFYGRKDLEYLRDKKIENHRKFDSPRAMQQTFARLLALLPEGYNPSHRFASYEQEFHKVSPKRLRTQLRTSDVGFCTDSAAPIILRFDFDWLWIKRVDKKDPYAGKFRLEVIRREAAEIPDEYLYEEKQRTTNPHLCLGMDDTGWYVRARQWQQSAGSGLERFEGDWRKHLLKLLSAPPYLVSEDIRTGEPSSAVHTGIGGAKHTMTTRSFPTCSRSSPVSTSDTYSGSSSESESPNACRASLDESDESEDVALRLPVGKMRKSGVLRVLRYAGDSKGGV
ncbi:hypothetical protein K488DRAFT_71500 [Vararia minispora EC-137]|uniref:Uncharacterized protein n=1 Tax=Vararia minispora EC-137 TaxID=1314806 RepID=A0ACB8QIB8_9AGAM|nr:hypothetical protein K488DRAFT_71500 [Vararia minispora EC-137]